MASDVQNSLEQFKKTLEALYGETLNDKASLTADDFWRHLDQIKRGIQEREITIPVDMLFLARQFREYGRYHTWKGLGIVLIGIGLITLFFNPIVGGLVISAALLSCGYGKYIKRSDARGFASDLIEGVDRENGITGIANVCAHYIAGTIGLSSIHGTAFYPLYPSCVLDGSERFVKDA